MNKTLNSKVRPSTYTSALLVAAAVSALVACGVRMPSLNGLQTNQLGLPEAIRVPSGHQIALQAHGSGDLLYVCQAIKRAPYQYAWLLQTSNVRLQDSYGRSIIYYPGTRSRWVHSDGSQIVAQESVEAPATGTSLPQQRAKIEVPQAAGTSGALSRVSYVQTLRSVGGVVTANPCVAGSLGMRVTAPLESDYVFWQPSV